LVCCFGRDEWQPGKIAAPRRRFPCRSSLESLYSGRRKAQPNIRMCEYARGAAVPSVNLHAQK